MGTHAAGVHPGMGSDWWPLPPPGTMLRQWFLGPLGRAGSLLAGRLRTTFVEFDACGSKARTRRGAGTILIAISGPATRAEAPGIRADLLRVLHSGLDVVVSLRSSTDIDSAGIAVLVEAAALALARARARARSLVLAGVPPTTIAQIGVFKLSDVLIIQCRTGPVCHGVSVERTAAAARARSPAGFPMRKPPGQGGDG